MPPFVDTNILVYAYDTRAGVKHDRARNLLMKLWQATERPFVSIQVLQEFYVTLIRLGLPKEDAARLVKAYLSFNVIENTRELFALSLDLQSRWQTSFWDASILAAAKQAGASELWSEDFNEGQDYDGVRVCNPLHQP